MKSTPPHRINRLTPIRLVSPYFSTGFYGARDKFAKEIQPKILLRDNYTCLLCGVRGEVMNVHHIETWAESPNRRFDETNLITLCKPCHINAVHKGNVHRPCSQEIKDMLVVKINIR